MSASRRKKSAPDGSHANADRVLADRILAGRLSDYALDPLGFVRAVFPWGQGALADEPGPDDWQADVLTALGEALPVADAKRLATQLDEKQSAIKKQRSAIAEVTAYLDRLISGRTTMHSYRITNK